MAGDLTDEEIDALAANGTLSPETAAKMKAGLQPKATGPNYGTAVAKMTGAELMEPVPGMTSPWQKAMATAATKAAEDAVAKYHAATRVEQPAPLAAPAITTPAPGLVAPGTKFEMPKPRAGEGGPGIEEQLGIAPKPAPKTAEQMATANVGKPAAASPKVATNLIDPALLDALHSKGELSDETAAKLHAMNGTESKVAKAEAKVAKDEEKLATAEQAK